MAGYVASKVRAVKDRLLGLWQHARARRSSAGFSSADDVFRPPHEGGLGGGSEGRAHSALQFTAAPGVERGLQHLVLGGRDAPRRQGDSWQDHSWQDRNWQDHRAELEITGFLDRLPPHPLLAEECRPPVTASAASPGRQAESIRAGGRS